MSRSAHDFETCLLQVASLARHRLGPSVARALANALQAVDPHRLVEQAVAWDDGVLRIGDAQLRLPEGGRFFVAGAGKAGLAMAHALVRRLGERIAEGVVVVKPGGDELPDAVGRIRVMAGGHPVPDARSIAGGRELLALARRAGPEDVVICPISGGASSLVAAPVGDVTLEDLQAVTDTLLRSGVDIEAFNAVRKHLDAFKGGGLALAAAPANIVALVLSDVPGDPLDVIASGPTVGDRSTFEDALAVLQRVDRPEALPERVVRWLEDGRDGHYPETPTPDDPRLGGVRTVLLAGNETAMEVTARGLEREGIRVVGQHALQGEARSAGRALAERTAALEARSAVVAGGETTVTIRGDGVGGRNLEVALAAVEPLAAVEGALLVTLATDGDDGPTGAAGAVVTHETLARARGLGLDAQDHLARNDSLAFFDALGDAIRTGPTGTNVCDLALACIEPRRPTRHASS